MPDFKVGDKVWFVQSALSVTPESLFAVVRQGIIQEVYTSFPGGYRVKPDDGGTPLFASAVSADYAGAKQMAIERVASAKREYAMKFNQILATFGL